MKNEIKVGRLNNLKGLAPTLAKNFLEEKTSENIEEEYSKKLERYKDIIGIGNKYFFGHLHDSRILSLKVKNNNLHLVINDMATNEFANALINRRKLKMNVSKLKFPLEIRTEETNHISLNIVGEDGKIYKSRFVKLTEYLYEEIIEWTEERIEMAFDLFNTKLYPKCEYLLLLACKKIKIIENQTKYWKKYFGERYNRYYKYFMKERDKGKYLSDYSLCEKLLNEIEEGNV